MPTREPVVDTMIPKEVEKPIPTRTVQTRAIPISKPAGDQPSISKGPAVSVTPPPPEESVKLSPQLAAFARKEQEHRKKVQAFEQREKALEARLSDADKFLKLQEKLKAKDFSSLEEMGVDYEGYTNYLLNKRGSQDPQAAEMQKLADELANLKKSQEEKDQEEREGFIEYSRKEVKSLVEKNPEFSSVKELKREEVAVQLMIDTLEQDGEEMTAEEALKQVEEFSVEEARQFSQLSKLKPKEEPKEEAPKMVNPKPQGLRTLTNQVKVEAPEQPKPLKSLQHMSDAERIEEARRRVMARRQSQ